MHRGGGREGGGGSFNCNDAGRVFLKHENTLFGLFIFKHPTVRSSLPQKLWGISRSQTQLFLNHCEQMNTENPM